MEVELLALSLLSGAGFKRNQPPLVGLAVGPCVGLGVGFCVGYLDGGLDGSTVGEVEGIGVV
jgi:hypothetical protein